MDPQKFDRMIGQLAQALSRRSLVGGSLGASVLAALGLGDEALAKKKVRADGKKKAKAEACIPTGKKCPAPKPRGRTGQNRKPKKLGCDKCCQGHSVANRRGGRRCACKPSTRGCSTGSECCSGSCRGGVCTSGGTALPPPPCQPESAAQTCASRCATVTNNCGTPVDCGACDCGTCPVCQTCDVRTGQCVPNPDEVGDPCDTCRTCDAAGQCLIVANTTPCDDGNLCTQDDTCQNGVCVEGNSITCPAPTQCKEAGDCNPLTGACEYPNKPNGTACNDGNLCTQTDTCQNGDCVGDNLVVCPASQCQNPGTCDPATGLCSPATNKPNSTACNDGDTCTSDDVCLSGTCKGKAIEGCCHPVGSEECARDTSCCGADGTTGGGVCAPTGCCLAVNEICTAAEQCCSGVCSPTTTVGVSRCACGATGTPCGTNGFTCCSGSCQGGLCV